MNYEPKLEDYLKRENLTAHREDGLVLFDYNKTVTFNFDWDDITLNARGIVFEEATGMVVANPFKKFFNHSEISSPERLAILPPAYHPNYEGELMCLEKADGSCGITFPYKNKWRVNTRGSFNSSQAIWATKWLNTNVDVSLMNLQYTYLFEIVYPENKIVVDYGDKEALVLTGIIETATGRELFVDELELEAKRIGVEMVKIFKFNNLEEIFSAREGLSANEEGYVITFRNGYKFKLKGDAYCNLHRSICNITPLNFWRNFDIENMCVSVDLLKELPEEFKFTVDKLNEIINAQFKTEYDKIVALYKTVPFFASDAEGKKARYMWLSDKANGIPSEYVACVLNLINGQEMKLRDWVLRKIRPNANVIEGIDSRIYRIQNDDG